jgi:hypothetical protein
MTFSTTGSENDPGEKAGGIPPNPSAVTMTLPYTDVGGDWIGKLPVVCMRRSSEFEPSRNSADGALSARFLLRRRHSMIARKSRTMKITPPTVAPTMTGIFTPLEVTEATGLGVAVVEDMSKAFVPEEVADGGSRVAVSVATV